MGSFPTEVGGFKPDFWKMNFTYVGELEFGASKIKVDLPALGWILADDGTHYLYFMAEGKAAGHSISGGGFATLDR